MKRAFTTSSLILVVLLFLALTGCRSGSGDLTQADTQRRFGVRMARMNLWREAMFRFKRATEIEPDNAMAHNNLAVAYEAVGDFDAAAREYREALRLDRSNQYIQKNYSRYVEFVQRSKKREQQRPATSAASATATAPAAAPPETTTTPPPPPPATTTNPPEEGVR